MRETIEAIVLESLSLANQSRPANRQLRVDPEATLFGDGSSLDSLGLVGLLIDIEDNLRTANVEIDLSTAQAFSVRNSPFRTVKTLVDYVATRVGHGSL